MSVFIIGDSLEEIHHELLKMLLNPVKVCDGCGKEYRSSQPRSKYCSGRCKGRAKNTRYNENKKRRQPSQELGTIHLTQEEEWREGISER